MKRVGAGGECRGDDAVGTQIRVGRTLAADRDDAIAGTHVRRIAIGVGGDRDRLDAEPARGACDAHGDLAAIGDEKSACESGHGASLSRAPAACACTWR